MQIKLLKSKNVYGVRQPVGKVLISGNTIPPWQAEAFVKYGNAEIFTPPKPKVKKKVSIK